MTKFALGYLTDAHDGAISAAILTLGELILHAARSSDLEGVTQLVASILPFMQSEVAQIRLDTTSRFQLLGETSADAAFAVYDSVLPVLTARAQDPNGPVRTAVVGACHTMLQFHVADGFDRAEKLVGTYHAKAMKRNANDATAMLLFVKKSVAKAKVGPVTDELWASTQQGETLSDPSSSSSSGPAAEDEDDDEDDE